MKEKNYLKASFQLQKDSIDILLLLDNFMSQHTDEIQTDVNGQVKNYFLILKNNVEIEYIVSHLISNHFSILVELVVFYKNKYIYYKHEPV